MANKSEWLHMRKGRYMAQLLEEFEKKIEPHVPADVAAEFKGQTRRKLNALAVDACDVMNLDPNTEINGHAQDIRDRLHPDGAAQARR